MFASATDYLRRDPGDPTIFADELTVVHTVLDAVLFARPAVLLTTRPEVVEQFRALAMILNQFYRSWSLAKFSGAAFAKNLSENSRFEGPLGTGFIFDIRRETFIQAMPQHSFDFQVTCWLLRDGAGENVQCYPTVCRFERPIVHMLGDGYVRRFLGLPNMSNLTMQVVENPSRGDEYLQCWVNESSESDLAGWGCNDLELSIEKVSRFDLLRFTNMGVEIDSPWLRAVRSI